MIKARLEYRPYNTQNDLYKEFILKAFRCFIFIAAVLLLGHSLLSVSSHEAFAQSQQPEIAQSRISIESWIERLDQAEARLEKPQLTDDVLLSLRDQLEVLRGETRSWIADFGPTVQSAEKQLADLGPAPAEGEEPEAGSIAEQRARLKRDLAELTGKVKEAELIISRANQLISSIGSLRRERFASQLVQRGPLPLSPATWNRALPELKTIGGSVNQAVGSIWASVEFQTKLRNSLFAIIFSLFVAVILAWPLRNWLLRHYGRDSSIPKPNYMQAVRATLVVGATRALLPTAAAALIYIVALNRGLIFGLGQDVAQAIFLGVLLYTWTVAFFRASMSPTYPDWRILPVPTNFSRGIWVTIVILAFVVAADVVLVEVITAYDARLAVTAIKDYALTVIIGGLLIAVMLRQQMWVPDEEVDGKPRWQVLRLLAAIGLLVTIGLGAFGYVALARFIIFQLVLTGGLLLVLLLLHRLGHEFLSHLFSEENWLGEFLRRTLQMEDAGTEHFIFWIGLLYTTLLILAGLLIGLLLWGAERSDVVEAVYRALFGFKVGQITISLADVFFGIVFFVGLVIATRLLQQTLSEKVFPHTKTDPSLSQSITTTLGYVGIIIAATVGITTIGVDFTNLAIIAGALSVGIGFGLQNVVNNFVSGLILLAERPVKVGDWVVVGGNQGYVKRIKVRATEIQTFDRASVFIPNSQLISEAVTNWTYADKMGRVIIPVGVAYGTDTKKVRDVLQRIGNAHPEVLKAPAPTAVFRGFGDSSLNFELRCFLNDVEATISVSSDLCFAIEEEFRKENIEIPFPQHDVHISQNSLPAAQKT